MERMAVVLILLGLALIVIYGGFFLIKSLLLDAGMPILIKIGLILILLGIIVVLIKMIWERARGGDDEDVNRKY
ncbi:hypothetical protein BBF96_06340 [Anoxybacter fermentans]|uniref:Uncharacterized protein n=1 Tax=Anoxybacter fermentans TaxID=1323375 RepID=A0A3Q9HQ67_9FIRM|nr:hypothetical protein [Anoxybacter fermentans]AZR73050.1 hypothetical protein BBF96_06340 [Anoxybacter fermentans]